MMKRLLILLILCLVGLAGCFETRAGPFVTDVTFDGEGNLVVTKNMVVHDSFTATISNGENPEIVVIKAPKK